MKHLTTTLICLLSSLFATAQQISSPNGRLTVTTSNGQMIVCHSGTPVLTIEGPNIISLNSHPLPLTSNYQMLTGKRLVCNNEGNEYVATLGEGVKMVLRLYNDGIAFRYEYPKAWTGSDPTVFRIPEGTRRWMQQWTDAYEGFFPLSTTYKVKPVPSFSGISKSEEGYNNRWGYPALLEPHDGVFVLLSEANIERGQSASCLYNDKELYKVVPAERLENNASPSHLTFSPFHTPWRVAIIGSLADIVESTLITDVSNPCQLEDTSWIKPGVVSWVYWAYNHGSNDYSIIKKYVDMAATLHLPYVLIDAEWDQMDQLASNEGKTIEDSR